MMETDANLVMKKNSPRLREQFKPMMKVAKKEKDNRADLVDHQQSREHQMLDII